MTTIRRPDRAAVRRALAACATPLLALSMAPTASAAGHRPADPSITVMTRNLYLGGDIASPVGAKTPADFAQRNSAVLATIDRNDFPGRAKLLAAEIAKAKPALIGMQEAATISRSANGTAGKGTPTSIPLFDYLKTLQRELARRGLRYSTVVNGRAADVRGPVTEGYDVRLTLHDVILVRRTKGLTVRRSGSARYKAGFTVPSAIGPIPVRRGYGYADVTYRQRRFRFLTTHLESFVDATRVAQTRELVARGGAARVKTPIIVVGDLNSDPRGRSQDAAGAYNVLRGFGMQDAWTQVHGNAPGLTCCHSKDLDGPPPADDPPSRVDHVFIKGGHYRATKDVITGAKARAKIPKWGSDHSGVAATIRLKK